MGVLLSRRRFISERYQALTLSLSLHVALLSLLFVSFYQPGLPSGTTSTVTPITLVSAESLSELQNLPPLHAPPTAAETDTLTTAENAAPKGGEPALLLQTLTGADSLIAEMRRNTQHQYETTPTPRESDHYQPVIVAEASAPTQELADSVIVTNAKKQNTAGQDFIIAIMISPTQASVEIIPASAAYRFQ